MRNDFKIALLCFVASVPAGVAVSEAIEYFEFLKAYRGLSFYSSATITLILLAAAAILAVRGEAEKQGAKKRMLPLIGMIVFGIGFIGCAAWYFWPANASVETASIKNPAEIAPAQLPPSEAIQPSALGGKGGRGEIFGDKGTIIGGKGGNVGAGGMGRGGDGGGGVIHGDG
jgi:hypothetical protein